MKEKEGKKEVNIYIYISVHNTYFRVLRIKAERQCSGAICNTSSVFTSAERLLYYTYSLVVRIKVKTVLQCYLHVDFAC